MIELARALTSLLNGQRVIRIERSGITGTITVKVVQAR